MEKINLKDIIDEETPLEKRLYALASCLQCLARDASECRERGLYKTLKLIQSEANFRLEEIRIQRVISKLQET